MIQARAVYSAMALVIIFSYLAIGGCKPAEVELDHKAVGKWQTKDGVTIAFYKDGVAAVEGSKVQWRPIDESSVRIEDEKQIAEFVISESDDGRIVGVIELAGREMTSVFGRNMTYTKVAKKTS